MTVPELVEGVRLRLRRSGVDDAPALHRVASDPAVVRYLEWPAPRSPDDTWQFLAGSAGRWAAGQEHHWAIVLKPSGDVVGSIAARVRGHAADLGLMLAPGHWGRGLGREAAGLLAGMLLRQAGIERVWASVDVDDARSRRLLESIGFGLEGVMRRAVVRPALGPGPRDAVLYARVNAPAVVPGPATPIPH